MIAAPQGRGELPWYSDVEENNKRHFLNRKWRFGVPVGIRTQGLSLRSTNMAFLLHYPQCCVMLRNPYSTRENCDLFAK